MKLLYLLLAHSRAADLVELASTLVKASSDAHAVIHYDLNSPVSEFEDLLKRLAQHERVHCVANRVACEWGSYELVQASLNGIREARLLDIDFDYVILLSGDCYPSKPVKQLEAYLSANFGREFIEAMDENWIHDGLRSERYQFYFPFRPRRNASLAERYATKLQRLLGVRRRVPAGLNVRFGSQWWALTWKTAVAAVDFLDQRPTLQSFFKYVFIPDEMVFPTIVHHLVSAEKISGFGLTHFQFTDRGRPVVYYDDHGEYPLATSKFFVRKIAPEARRLRARCLQRAFEDDPESVPSNVGAPTKDYELKVRAQTDYPVPGQIFYRDQYRDMSDTVLRRTDGNYIVVCGEREQVRSVLMQLSKAEFQTFGFLFQQDEVDFGPTIATFRGLSRTDSKIRDLHPALYLARVRRRTDKPCVFGWAPGDHHGLLMAALWDPAALTTSLLPLHMKEFLAQKHLSLGAIANEEFVALRAFTDRRRLNNAYVDMVAEQPPRELLWENDAPRRENMLFLPMGCRQQDEVFAKSIQTNIFQNETWFPALVDGLKPPRSGADAQGIEA